MVILNFFYVLPKYLNVQGPLHPGPHVLPSILSYCCATCFLSSSFFPKASILFHATTVPYSVPSAQNAHTQFFI